MMCRQAIATDLIPPVGERDHIRGPEDAPVTLVEYGDYDCPWTGRAYPVGKALLREFSGRLAFVFRAFPLTRIHENAQAAAEASEAAAVQGKFWEMHDRLFESRRKLSRDDLLHYAEEVGLDVERFRRETEERVHARAVRASLKSGLESGVTGTPAFFLNGIRYEGPYDLDALSDAISGAFTPA